MQSTANASKCPGTSSTGHGINTGAERGQFRGRGRGSGRGGRGERGGFYRRVEKSGGSDIGSKDGTETFGGERTPRPRLTHFLALPLGHHAELRARMSTFTQALLDGTPAIPGLDRSIVIPARRLHLTLGVMSLDGSDSSSSTSARDHKQLGVARPRTLDSAISLLKELRPRILDLLQSRPLSVALHQADIMRPDQGDLEKAHVMWVGPTGHDNETKRLKIVAEFINGEFRKVGLVVDEKRPLKLHCTVLNTVYRKPRNSRRTPFSYSTILASSAFRAIEVLDATLPNPGHGPQPAPTGGLAKKESMRGRKPISVDLGRWAVDEVQICEMGSWGPEGEYVCVGRIPLR